MKARTKSIFNIFMLLTLLAMLISLLPASSVQAESPASPLYAGGDFVWAKSMGGWNYDLGSDIAVDSSGNVYTTGYFSDTADFNPGAGIYNLTSAGSGDIFVSKLDSNGNFLWAKSMGGMDDDRGLGIAVDSSGNVYTTGFFKGTVDFDPGAGTASLTSAGVQSIFISKLNSSGNFVWVKNMDTSGLGNIAVDSGGNVYTTGSFAGTVDFDPGAGTTNLTSRAGSSDIFVSKLDSNGNFVWAKSMGGTDNDSGTDITIDSSGNVYTTGDFTTGVFQVTADFDPGPGTYNLTGTGKIDTFISKLDSNGDFVWARGLLGTGFTTVEGIAVDSSSNVYTTGTIEGITDFDPGIGTFNLTSTGFTQIYFSTWDIFISKLDSNGDFAWAKSIGGTGNDDGNSIALDSSGNVYTTGSFELTADFDPGAGTANLTSAGFDDIFISKLDGSGNLAWAKSMGGALGNYGYGIAIDSDGNVYTTGSFAGATDFDPGAGTFNLNTAGITDIFVSKLGNSAIFTDVSYSYWASSYIERLYNAGVTGGCATTPSLMYCPDSTVTRAQMAVFLLKGMHGSNYVPPSVGISTGFTDVATNYWAASWIKQLAAEGITGGCGSGNYCPDATVTRAQMAVFLLKAKHGSSYSPPAATGVFTDVPVGYWADKWIEQLASEGITGGCGTGIYCPDSSVTRAQMAVFLVKAFNLP